MQVDMLQCEAVTLPFMLNTRLKYHILLIYCNKSIRHDPTVDNVHITNTKLQLKARVFHSFKQDTVTSIRPIWSLPCTRYNKFKVPVYCILSTLVPHMPIWLLSTHNLVTSIKLAVRSIQKAIETGVSEANI